MNTKRDDVILRVTSLVKDYGDRGLLRGPRADATRPRQTKIAVDDVGFEVTRGEFFTLVGPSGCGKTTTLRLIAGLEDADRGKIEVGGRVLFDAGKGINVPPNLRKLGMVFQSYAIWPHLNVFKNVSFPLESFPRAERLPKREVRDRVMRVLDMLGLEAFASRPATDLSGGQQQRLALARALVAQPELLLLDEPLSNLDARLRDSVRVELKRLQREIGITTVYVTHDQSEALSLSNRLAVLRDGKILQVDKPRVVYDRPADEFVASFVGKINRIPISGIDQHTDGVRMLNTGIGRVAVEAAEVTMAEESDLSNDPFNLAVRPEDINISDVSLEGPNQYEGEIVARAFVGEAEEYVVRVNSTEIDVRSAPDVRFGVGATVSISIPVETCRVFKADSTA